MAWSESSSTARPPGPEYAGELLDGRLRVGEVLQHPLAPEQVDAVIGERQVGGQAVDEADSR